jgi:hypothetical protein
MSDSAAPGENKLQEFKRAAQGFVAPEITELSVEMGKSVAHINSLETTMQIRFHRTDQKIDGLDGSLTAQINHLNSQIEILNSNLTTHIDILNSSPNSQIEILNGNLTTRIDVLNSELTTRIDVLRDKMESERVRMATMLGQLRAEIEHENNNKIALVRERVALLELGRR